MKPNWDRDQLFAGEARCRVRFMRLGLIAFLALFAHIASSEERSMTVTASAYNSTHAQTDSQPNRGAWGDPIQPGMKVIAVSPDLLEAGLRRGVRVRIDGSEGEWTVLDRTPSRLRNHIDIYMGLDIPAARRWGKRHVVIRWRTPQETREGLPDVDRSTATSAGG
ncbi:MAG TPA: hypothetical protein VHK24_14485 [Steroidobacter sp.]|jgi:3D (Asp-Asp-Asp) domain-containing protein|nr:hypothetical protein [Steroidobacter sp.]